MHINDIPEIGKLSIPENGLLVEELWDSIVSDESIVPVPQSHNDELDKRFKRYESAPENVLTLDELRIRIDKRK